jgi:hypothetical protein
LQVINSAKIIVATLLLPLAAAGVNAQSPPADDSPLRIAPPPIAFEPWREAQRNSISVEYRTTFPSPMVTESEENDRVPIRAFLPANASGPVPAALVIHYLGANDLRIETSLATELNKKGLAAVLLTLPYHLSRTPPGYRSGERAVVADPHELTKVLIQCVYDARRTLDWMQSRPEFETDKVAIAGTSLGALVATLVYALDTRVKAGAFILGGADLAHIVWHSSRVVSQRDAMRQRGMTERKLRELLAPVEPLTFLPEAPRRPTFVVGAVFDTVMPADDTRKLIGALPSPDVLWLESGHYGGALVEARLHRTVAGFLRNSLLGEPFAPPRSLNVPTVRLGFHGMPETGLQVAIGFDIWRSNPRGDAFASVVVTPRGLSGFAGMHISRGLAVGVSLRQKKLVPGAFWNVVL